METEHPFCSELSLKAGEPLFASATPTRLYLLLEYDGAWGSKAMEESNMPEAVKNRLKDFTRATPEAKLLLIRREKSVSRISSQESSSISGQTPELSSGKEPAAPGKNFYLAQAAESGSRLFRFSLENYLQLLEIELEGFIAEEERYKAFRSSEKLALVCTNGRRDRCCARFGAAVYQTLNQVSWDPAEMSVWQSSHMGGHRFAANLLVLPEGLLYGRVNPDNAVNILNEHLQGRLSLDHLRGRTPYPEAVQAAEHLLRQRTGEMGLESYSLADCRETSEGLWQVELLSAKGENLTVKLSMYLAESAVFESCSLDKKTRIKHYQLIE